MTLAYSTSSFDDPQEAVFSNSLQDLVDGFMRGLNDTVLACVQTGSGRRTPWARRDASARSWHAARDGARLDASWRARNIQNTTVIVQKPANPAGAAEARMAGLDLMARLAPNAVWDLLRMVYDREPRWRLPVLTRESDKPRKQAGYHR
ncbi:hypothetical protein WJX72_011610 [[Myrmecia] bisecta]|uniref:Uncharacterized protein n=1 Tax=[Myrmecia] bisecta TaxID=41462 RepID=A0AAW1PB88_9CHLO